MKLNEKGEPSIEQVLEVQSIRHVLRAGIRAQGPEKEEEHGEEHGK
jgi:hypothetical protein